MRRIWTDHGLRLLVFSAVLALIALIALCLVLLIRTNQTQEFRDQSARNCEQINLVKSAIRALIDDGEQSSLRREGLTADQVAAITEFYQRQRERFAGDKCP